MHKKRDKMNYKEEYERHGKKFQEAFEYQQKQRNKSFFQWLKDFFFKGGKK